MNFIYFQFQLGFFKNYTSVHFHFLFVESSPKTCLYVYSFLSIRKSLTWTAFKSGTPAPETLVHICNSSCLRIAFPTTFQRSCFNMQSKSRVAHLKKLFEIISSNYKNNITNFYIKAIWKCSRFLLDWFCNSIHNSWIKSIEIRKQFVRYRILEIKKIHGWEKLVSSFR